VVGAILIGAVHDFACLFVSMREGGKTIAAVMRRLLGDGPFVLFALYIIFNLVLVNAAFLNLTAQTLTQTYELATLNLPEEWCPFRVVQGADGRPMAVAGGVASTSAIVLTLVAPLLGYLLVKRRMPEKFGYPLAAVVCVGSVVAGFYYPVTLPGQIDFAAWPPASWLAGWIDPAHLVLSATQVWVLVLAAYVLVAAAVPVWLILQPREFVSVQFLYIGIGLMVASLIGVGFMGKPIQAAPTPLEQAAASGPLWPTLFITIACGSISGFHGLVASGTTCKQVSSELHCRHIGYGGMLGESMLAVCVTLALAVGLSQTDYLRYASTPTGAFALSVGSIFEGGLMIPIWAGVVFGLLMVEGFILDTLDVAIRLNRLLFEEVWNVLLRGKVPAILRSPWTNAAISVALMLALALPNAAKVLWPIFGTGNQLLGAISLMTITLWFATHRKQALFVFIPAILIAITTFASLIYLFFAKYLPEKNYVLATAAAIFFIIAGVLIGQIVPKIFTELRRRDPQGAAA
jgi:carbon starvation protein